jgi:hypothetical protein
MAPKRAGAITVNEVLGLTTPMKGSLIKWLSKP